MAINFNDSPEQKTGGGAIPPKSIVKMRLEIREPSGTKCHESHNLVTVFKSGLIGFDCILEVIAGQFNENKIYENLFFRPDFQSIEMTTGQTGICNGSDAKFRAMIEASRGIDPGDGSPASVNARMINDWSDFQGMEFPVLVGIKKQKADDQYINNNIMRIITPEHDDYQKVMGGGEIISKLPLPATPEPTKTGGGYQAPGAGKTAPANTGGKPAWA
jgi:hypothetical protein